VKIILYIRVSSTNKADHEPSATEQERKIRAWAREHGHQIIAVYRDEGVSGANGVDTRTGLPQALAALKAREASGLAVVKLDRLSRDLIVQEQLMADVRRLGAQMFTVSAAEQAYLGDDPDDPSRKLIRQVLGSVVEYERSMTALRLRGGKARKRSEGRYAGGYVPYGSAVQGREFVPAEAELATLARIRELGAEGRSLREIAAVLEAEGHRTKHGARWHPSTVGRLLAREDTR
jgi:DNA invertase Pin-like site-specific DNA recombinase